MLEIFLGQNDLVSFHIFSYLSYHECCNVIFLNKTFLSLLYPQQDFLSFRSSFLHQLPRSDLLSLISYTSSSPFIPLSISPPSSHYIWMVLVTKKLNISYPLTSYSSLEHSLGGWKQIFHVIDALEKNLNLMGSPGCQIQKYLRSFIGLKANSPLVKNVIKGVTLLPATLEACFHSMTICDFTSELEGAWYTMNTSQVDPRMSDRVHNMSNISVNYNDEFLPRYLRLFAWVVSDQAHLRVLMAQYEQLACRGFRSSREHSRCTEALRDLIRMRNGEFEAVRLWA
jgi:hypothetical protein